MNMSIESKALLVVAVMAVIAMIGVAVLPAHADSIGAPTSAAGGVSAPSSPSRPAAVGPIGASGSGTSGGSTSSGIRDLQPGTGKFEAPKNAPCLGTTGFGSTNSQPGHKC